MIVSSVVRAAVAAPTSMGYQSCLDRYFVQLEVRKAKQERKNVISVFEQEERRHAYFDYTKAWARYGTGAGQAAAHGGEFEFVLNVDSIRYLRNRYEADAMVNRILRKASGALPPPSASPVNAPGQWDFFLSHGQALAGDQTKMLCFLLRQRTKPNGEPYTVWYDNEMDSCSTEAMMEGELAPLPSPPRQQQRTLSHTTLPCLITFGC
jgi:hypothetical protein